MLSIVENFQPDEIVGFDNIITQNPQFINTIFPLIKTFASTDEHVLITGETGTGKDLTAQKIHDISSRKGRPFISVNLASISPNLFESELFGHKKGAFTDAREDKKGYFEVAEGGTLFLDEIGELPLHLQGKLLRAIQYSEICRVGEAIPRKLNVRLIFATNRKLSQLSEEKKFREDLYYRISRAEIKLPPLRERGEDILLLARYFLRKANKVYNKEIIDFNEGTKKMLMLHTFPGNVRQLENIVFGLVARTETDYIESLFANEVVKKEEIQKIPETHLEFIVQQLSEYASMQEVMTKYVEMVDKYTKGNTAKAAEILGISQRTLQRWKKNRRATHHLFQNM